MYLVMRSTRTLLTYDDMCRSLAHFDVGNIRRLAAHFGGIEGHCKMFLRKGRLAAIEINGHPVAMCFSLCSDCHSLEIANVSTVNLGPQQTFRTSARV
jgi:hypothetical protein